MTEPLVIVGGGGMARCVLDVVDAINLDQSGFGAPRYEVLGVVADPEPEPLRVPYLGPVAELDEMHGSVGYVVGIGDSQVRRKIAAALGGRRSPVLVHPNAHVGHGVDLGPGVVVCSHVSIEANARLGAHVHVNQNSTIGHDSVLEDFATVSPLVAVSGNVMVGEAAFLGTHSAIRERTRVGADAVVGMGAAVVTDVPDGATVAGVPASIRR